MSRKTGWKEQRQRNWAFILAFLFGAVLAELTADPISDLLLLRETHEGITVEEMVIYRYYVPAAVYFTLFMLALISFRTSILTPRTFVLLLIGFTAYGAYISIKTFSQNPVTTILLVVPVILLAVALLRGVGGYETAWRR